MTPAFEWGTFAEGWHCPVVSYLNKAQILRHAFPVCGNCVFQIQLRAEEMQNLTEIRQCLRRRRRKILIGHPVAMQGVRALSCLE